VKNEKLQRGGGRTRKKNTTYKGKKSGTLSGERNQKKLRGEAVSPHRLKGEERLIVRRRGAEGNPWSNLAEEK